MDDDVWRFSRPAVPRSSSSSSPSMAELRVALFAHTTQLSSSSSSSLSSLARSTRRQAGILVPVCERNGTLHLLLTQRTLHLSSHPGDCCFPGGRVDENENALSAALREADEEVGIRDAEVLGLLPPMLAKNGLVCLPVVAAIDANFVPIPNEREVAEVFTASIPFLLNNMKIVRHDTFTSFEWNVVRESDGKSFRVWGLTGAIIAYLLAVFFDLKLPNDLRDYLAQRQAKL